MSRTLLRTFTYQAHLQGSNTLRLARPATKYPMGQPRVSSSRVPTRSTTKMDSAIAGLFPIVNSRVPRLASVPTRVQSKSRAQAEAPNQYYHWWLVQLCYQESIVMVFKARRWLISLQYSYPRLLEFSKQRPGKSRQNSSRLILGQNSPL